MTLERDETHDREASSDQETHDREASEPTPPPPRRRRVWIPAALVVVVLLALAAWPAVAGYGRAKVLLLTDVEPLTCTGAEVVGFEFDRSPLAEIRMPVVALEEDMDCRLRFRIENRGPMTVYLHEVRLPLLGPDNGSRVRATALSPLGIEPQPDDIWAGDAIFPVDEPLEIRPGEVWSLAIVLQYSPQGCLSEGSTVWLQDEPTVTVRALGLPGQRRLIGDWFGFQGTTTSGTGRGCS